MCVQTTLFRQKKDGERLIAHLYNDINTTAFHALSTDDVPMREETLPIHDIKVTFHGYNIARAHLEPGGTDLPLTKVDGATRVVVPRLDVHAMVIAELER
jgi:hypothetical protein